MAVKKKSSIKSKKSAKSSSKLTKILARVLILLVLLGCVWEFLQNLNQAAPKIKATMILKLDTNVKGAGVFVPWGAAAVGDKIAVADNQNNRIMIFDRSGNFIKSWGTLGQKKDQFHEPSGLVADDKSNIYVIDSWNSAIKGFDIKGKQIADIDMTNMGFFGPRGLAYDGTNFLVADTGSHRIVTVSPKGEIISTWGTHGDGDLQIKGPVSVATDRLGHYFVADTDNNRLVWLDSSWKKIRYSKFDGNVVAVTSDKEGRVYASTKSDDGQTKVFDPNGKVLGTVIDQSGSLEPFKNVKSLSVTPDDLLLITTGDAIYLYNLPAFGQK
jgi:sugar lactone lactonase YvrE